MTNISLKDILSGKSFIIENENYEFEIIYANWNDSNFFTLFTLYLRKKENGLRINLGYLHVIAQGQRIGKIKDWFLFGNPKIFIGDIDTAKRLLIFLTPSQRKELERLLCIQYSINHSIVNERAFQVSVLRNQTLEEFKIKQQKIERLIHYKLNIAQIIFDNKNEIKELLEDI